MAHETLTSNTGSLFNIGGLFRQLGSLGSAIAGVAVATPLATTFPGYVSAAHEVCDHHLQARAVNDSGFTGVDFGEFLFLADGDVTRQGKPRRPPSNVTGLITNYTTADYYGYTNQEVCDKLLRSVFLTVSGTEGMESNNKNEPWYWDISHNRWNIEYHYPELMV